MLDYRHYGAVKFDLYCQIIYPKYIAELKDSHINLLEMGIHNGGSLRMWRDYFQYGHIYGLDIKPELMFQEDRIHTVCGSQDDPRAIEALRDQAGSFNVIIDDASHNCAIQIKSFELLFPCLERGGLYFIEDVWIAQKKNWNPTDTMTPYFAELARTVSSARNQEVDFVHFWVNMIVIGKKKDT